MVGFLTLSYKKYVDKQIVKNMKKIPLPLNIEKQALPNRTETQNTKKPWHHRPQH